jgi:hypothetical protein
MIRREFIMLGARPRRPVVAVAQRAVVPVISYLRSTPSAPFAHLTTAFHRV